MTLDGYLALLDWTGRQIRREKGKQGHIPDDFPAILDRLQCDAATWIDYVKNFRQRFRNEAGLPASNNHFEPRDLLFDNNPTWPSNLAGETRDNSIQINVAPLFSYQQIPSIVAKAIGDGI